MPAQQHSGDRQSWKHASSSDCNVPAVARGLPSGTAQQPTCPACPQRAAAACHQGGKSRGVGFPSLALQRSCGPGTCDLCVCPSVDDCPGVGRSREAPHVLRDFVAGSCGGQNAAVLRRAGDGRGGWLSIGTCRSVTSSPRRLLEVRLWQAFQPSRVRSALGGSQCQLPGCTTVQPCPVSATGHQVRPLGALPAAAATPSHPRTFHSSSPRQNTVAPLSVTATC